MKSISLPYTYLLLIGVKHQILTEPASIVTVTSLSGRTKLNPVVECSDVIA